MARSQKRQSCGSVLVVAGKKGTEIGCRTEEDCDDNVAGEITRFIPELVVSLACNAQQQGQEEAEK